MVGDKCQTIYELWLKSQSELGSFDEGSGDLSGRQLKQAEPVNCGIRAVTGHARSTARTPVTTSRMRVAPRATVRATSSMVCTSMATATTTAGGRRRAPPWRRLFRVASEGALRGGGGGSRRGSPHPPSVQGWPLRRRTVRRASRRRRQRRFEGRGGKLRRRQRGQEAALRSATSEPPRGQ